MSTPVLNVGIIVDGVEVPAWIAELLKSIEKGPAARIVHVEYAESISRAEGQVKRLYQRIDRSLFPVGEDALQQVPLPTPLTLSPHANKSVDVVLHLSRVSPTETDAPLGTWFFQPDLLRDTACLNATAEDATVATARLFAFYRGDAFCIDQTHTALHTYSVGRSNQRLYWTAHTFIPRRLEALQAQGADAFYRRHGHCAEPSAYTPAKSPSFSPFQLLKRTLRSGLSDWWQSTQWHVYFGIHNGTDLPPSFDHFTPLESPPGTYWADPFPFVHQDRLFLFFEEYDQHEKKGHIAALPFDQRGPSGPPIRVLETAGHLSYPFVFSYRDDLYMLPESSDKATVDLYRCTQFPNRWTYDRTLLKGIKAVDTTLCYHEGLWWLFTCIAAHPQSPARDELFLFYADSPLSEEWTPHPLNPVISDVRNARPAGRIIQQGERILRPAQDCSKRYGYGLHLREIETWNTAHYREKTHTSLLPTGTRLGLHTLNRQDQWVFVDIKVRKKKGTP